jgi:leader peptidase (prepilin peptidase)/N-methyltransferase
MQWSLVPAYLYLGVLSAALVLSDLRHQRLPNGWTLSAYPILLGLLVIPTAVIGDWWMLGRAFLGAVVTVIAFFVLASISPQGLGMGDVKLAGALALPLAWHSWMALLIAMAGAFIMSAIVGIGLLLARRVRRDALLPFGPFLIGATWLVIAFT